MLVGCGYEDLRGPTHRDELAPSTWEPRWVCLHLYLQEPGPLCCHGNLALLSLKLQQCLGTEGCGPAAGTAGLFPQGPCPALEGSWTHLQALTAWARAPEWDSNHRVGVTLPGVAFL